MKTVVYCMVVLLGATGCAHLMTERRETAMREQSEMENLRLTVSRLAERVDALAAAHTDIHGELDQLKTATSGEKEEIAGRLRKLKEELTESMKASQKELEKEIIDDLSAKIVEVMRAQPRPAPRSEHGRPHTVMPGETLSGIAGAYKVSVEAIIKANNLKDANSIRAGQELFIPE